MVVQQTLNASAIDAEFAKALHHNLHVIKFDNDNVDIKAGTIVGSDDGLDIINFLIDKRIDMTSNGLDALDTGAEAANTWYYVWAIKNSSTGAYGGLASLSDTAPTMPSGFDLKRLISAVWNDNLSDVHAMDQIGSSYHYVDDRTLFSLVSFTAVVFTDVDTLITADGNPETAVVDFVPANSRVARVDFRGYHTDGNDASLVHAPYDGWVGSGSGGRVGVSIPDGISNDILVSEVEALVDENRKLVILSDGNATGFFGMHIHGFDVIL